MSTKEYNGNESKEANYNEDKDKLEEKRRGNRRTGNNNKPGFLISSVCNVNATEEELLLS